MMYLILIYRFKELTVINRQRAARAHSRALPATAAQV
jgi:hypothetical protein